MPEITQEELDAVLPAFTAGAATEEVQFKETVHFELNEKGFEVWIKGEDRPMKGYPHPFICHPVWIWKRGLFTILRLVTSPWRYKAHLERYAEILWQYQNDPAKLSIGVRYIYFAALKAFPTWPNMCWGLAMIGEFDDGYRYFLQHLLGQANKADPTKRELRRLLKIFMARQSDEYTRNKMKTFSFLLWFIPAKNVKIFIESLETEKIKLDEDDLYWARKIKEYNFD